MELVARWWNGTWDRMARRDIWLTHDGDRWHVRARLGGDVSREVNYDYDREYVARAMVDRLMTTSPPARWKDVTRLLDRPPEG